ncbi:MAG TPA: LytR C-terminal domain-containing protein [Gaiellaceae bacterium]|nr:LytR C-terminal domain-containing protein [Gaiellaceae bacterium]
MEQTHDLVRPWRRATIAVSALAAVEMLLLTIVGIALFGKPLLHHFQSSAASAATPPKHAAKPAPAKAVLTRGEVVVMVLNGNGRAGAAHAAADRVQAKGYLLGNVGNAPRVMPHSVVMFRPGYAGEGRRLAHDLRVRIVRPLDGMRPSQLLGAHLVLILGT